MLLSVRREPNAFAPLLGFGAWRRPSWFARSGRGEGDLGSVDGVTGNLGLERPTGVPEAARGRRGGRGPSGAAGPRACFGSPEDAPAAWWVCAIPLTLS